MSEVPHLYKGKDYLGTFLSTWRNDVVLPFVKGRLLDLACGDNELVKKYGSGVGVDVKNYGFVNIVCPDFAHIPIESESIDTVTIVASLNYFPDPEAVLKEIYRILSPNGRIVFTMSNQYVMKLWHMFREPHAHRSSIPLMEIQSLLRRQKFLLKQKKFFMWYVNCVFVAQKYEET